MEIAFTIEFPKGFDLSAALGPATKDQRVAVFPAFQDDCKEFRMFAFCSSIERARQVLAAGVDEVSRTLSSAQATYNPVEVPSRLRVNRTESLQDDSAVLGHYLLPILESLADEIRIFATGNGTELTARFRERLSELFTLY